MYREKYCVANWKMNFTQSDIKSFIINWSEKKIVLSKVNVILCPSFTSINFTYELLLDSKIEIGAQNVSHETNGAFTGEISCNMLKDIGCYWVIIGHSERRTNFNEIDKIIKNKLQKILSHNLYPILCIGESKEERDAGKTEAILSKQLSILSTDYGYDLSKLVIAYEPVWAIGTGKTATSEMVSITHKTIRKILAKNGLNADKISILYGGSVNEDNAAKLSNIDNVDGFLVGGASLDVDKFYNIYNEL